MAGKKKTPTSKSPPKGKSDKGELTQEQLGKAVGGAPGTRPGTRSDARLKTDVQPIATGLEMIEALEPVSYRFIADGRPDVGFIAQQVRDVLPELVDEGDDGYLTIAYGQLTAPLVGAIRELAGELRALRRSHTAALSRIEALEAELARKPVA